MHPEKLIPYAKKNNKRKDKVMDDELIMIEFSDMSDLISRLEDIDTKIEYAYQFAGSMAKLISESDSVYYGQAKDLLENYNDNLMLKIDLLSQLVGKGITFVSLCLNASARENGEMQRIMQRFLDERKE